VDDGAPVVLDVAHRVVAERQRLQLGQLPELVNFHEVLYAVPVQVQHRQVREQQELLEQ